MTAPDKIFTIFGHSYTMLDPAAYGTDALVQSARKKYFLDTHPECRDTMRSVLHTSYAEWLDEIEDTPIDNALLASVALVAHNGGPDGDAPPIAVSELLAMRSWDANDALEEFIRFFHVARLAGYRDYLQSKNAGANSTKELEVASEAASAAETEEAASVETEAVVTTDPTTESTSPSNTKTE